MTDEAIEQAALLAFTRGDHRETLQILMDGYGRRVFAFCLQRVRNRDLADETQQRTFVSAYGSLDTFEARSTFRTWLFGIAHHRSHDVLSGQAVQDNHFVPLETLPGEGEARTNDDPGSEQALEAARLRYAVQRCLQQLTERVRVAVVLRFQEGLTYPEMQQAIQEQPATLQARVARSLPKLKRCLEQLGFEP